MPHPTKREILAVSLFAMSTRLSATEAPLASSTIAATAPALSKGSRMYVRAMRAMSNAMNIFNVRSSWVEAMASKQGMEGY